MMGLGASDFEFGVDPSADPELALVSNMQICTKCLITYHVCVDFFGGEILVF